ncbi:zinc finger protein 804B [Rhineura floridana]|uniref:zinc finger protein 804B n=1 Tax=Rhineura floridana TaxID=261503 RepID=UPI002AC847F0|nr:zinc finger protein 804B [Rhineura floridana]
MACYLVISSRHLSNGHYRGIKGIFRGPLCKNGSAAPDFAEKKAAAKALEDVKANFYCELCDKQYHKHHEFDNHINSYDHAHKQRLKELKQREFARNVASKSWKDEKKQEKALKRLHQLAELRKQSECVAGCGPVFKTPQVVAEKQQRPPDKLLLAQEGKVRNTAEGQSLTSSTSEKQQEPLLSKNQSCIETHPLLRNHISSAFSCSANACNRAGVSFSFSKKVHLKLESSASVFSENMEEAYDCIRSPRHKAKQGPEECHACVHVRDERKTNVQKQLNILQGGPDSFASCNLAGKNKMQKENDQNNRGQVESHLSFRKDKLHLPDLECSGSPSVKGGEFNETQKSLETIVTPQCQTSNICMQQNTSKHSNVLLPECVSEFSSQRSAERGHPCEGNYNPCVFKQPSDCTEIVHANTEMPGDDALVREIEPKTLPFLHVLSKDGSTALRWPTELLLFTKTEPSISYGCNPLYFDFRLSLSHRDSGHHEVNMESPKEHSTKTMDIDGNDTSGFTENEQLSNEKDNRSSKPKKKKRALSLKTSWPKLDSDTENEINQSAQKYISDDLNENLPKVPAPLDCSQRHYTRATSPCTMHVRSLAQHLQKCEKTLQDEVTENVCIYPLVSRTKKQKCTKCDLMHFQRQTNLDLVTCSSDISDSGKDFNLRYKLDSPRECLGNEGNEDFAGCWKFTSLQKPFSGRQSNYSDTSVSSATSYASCYSSHRSSDHSRSHLPFCCKRKQKPVERQKCKHKKHNCVSSSDDADGGCLFNKTSQRSRNCTYRHVVKYQRHSRYRHLLQRGISKQSRDRHPLCKHSRSRSYSSSRGSSIQDSGSSVRSSSCTRSRASSSGSLAKESRHDWNKHSKDMKRTDRAEPGKSGPAHSDCQNVSCPSKQVGSCSVNRLGREAVGKKSLTAKLLLEKVKSKQNQEQTQNTESFPKVCGIDLPHSQPGINCTSSVDSDSMLPLLKKALNIDTPSRWNNGTGTVESSAGTGQAEASAIDNVTLTSSTNYGNSLLSDLGYQALNIAKDAATKEQSNHSTGEMQPLLQSCDSVPNDFPGAFPSHGYSAVPSVTETKEEHNASVNVNRVEGNLNCYSDSAMHKSGETENKTELYSKRISSPLTQQPITFSPDEIDKYRFLQLQAQQHMQKQLVAKHLKVLPATGSASSALQTVPVQQHSSVATLHHTLLQSFALSAGVHPHSSHLSLTHIHPFSQSHFAPLSLSPFTPAFMPTHSAFLTGHPFHLVSATPIHPSHLAIPPLPHAAFIPTLFTPQLNAAASSAIHLNPFIHPLFQSQELQHRS